MQRKISMIFSYTLAILLGIWLWLKESYYKLKDNKYEK